jgi:fructokinase
VYWLLDSSRFFRIVGEASGEELGETGTVGGGIPGTVALNGFVEKCEFKLAKRGMPLEQDLSLQPGRPIRCENDANPLAVSEASDGRGAGHQVVFAAILGTGYDGGLTIGARVHER